METSIEEFRKLGLSENILKVIAELGFKEPSEIQKKAIPLVIEGKDVIGGSATGSGKTLAFAAGIIQHSEARQGIQALIFSPTRELAEQVGKTFRKFAKHYILTVAEVYGGVGIEPQIEALKKAEIVVGTPGRILDHLERGTIELHKVRTLVLDEADRMLDMGFIDDVEKIINHCKNRKQTLLFSATINADIERIAERYMKDVANIEAESYVDASKLKQVWYDVQQNVKFSLLVHLLRQEKAGLVMVFCNTRENSDFIAQNLKRYKLHALAIHGGLSQNKRTNVMEQFKHGEVYILVCTDVAARGLDIKGVSHVYNYDIPKTDDEYIHRIGRTARAGKEGIAVSLVSSRDYDNFRRVMENPDLKIEQIEVPQMEFVRPFFGQREERFDRRGFGRERRFAGRGSKGFGGGRFSGRSGGRYQRRQGSFTRRGFGRR